MQELVKALIKAKRNFKPIERNARAYNYKYSPLDVVIAATQDYLSDEGLVVIQSLASLVNSNGQNEIGVRTILAHESGESTDSAFYIIPEKKDIQSIGSMITYMRRYSYLAILGLAPVDEDDDGKMAVEGRPIVRKTRSEEEYEKDVEEDPGAYRIKIGKLKGTRLDAIDKKELASYLVWMSNQKDLSGPLKEAYAAINLYLGD